MDEYLEGALARDEHDAAAVHLQHCGRCQRRLANVQSLCAALRALPVPAPRVGFFEHALKRVQGPRAARHIGWTYAASAALAASLVLWIGFGGTPDVRHAPTAKPIGVTIALHQTRTVQLAFNAERDLQQATLSIVLPDGVELQGFPGQRQVSWQTNIARGANVLALPLIAVSPSNGVLLARLEHGDRSTELTVPLQVDGPTHTSALPSTCVTVNYCTPGFKEVINADA